ncbi:unnamed protein product [Arctia plantaginis]|uniref:Uncharacterized protein n=1 Tax=Arctia plantaginis TaxID=874455 RepID=A0A8S1BBB2_ARCPL|nr:unnamed protein product [Arctia plantaginis]
MIGKVARPQSLISSDVENDEINIDLDVLRKSAANNIEKSSDYDRKRFNSSKAKLNKFAVGEFVLIEKQERNQTKLDPKFKGPFKIIELLDGDRYLLKALNSKRTYKYAHDRVRKMPKALSEFNENCNLPECNNGVVESSLNIADDCS